MSINLLEKVQEGLHYPPLKKIDPNTQQLHSDTATLSEERFSQAAIPAILVGLYKYSSTDEGAKDILHSGHSENWISKIFDNTKHEVTETIASYINEPKKASFEKMNVIANEAVKITKQNLPAEATGKDVKTFFSDQVNNILPYLTAALHMGDFLNDTTLDDNTNKMEGPISSLMHSIGAAFSTPETEEDKQQDI